MRGYVHSRTLAPEKTAKEPAGALGGGLFSVGVLAVAPLARRYGRLNSGDVLAAASPGGF